MEAQERKGDGQTVKRVALPDGKTIEVVYFHEATPAAAPSRNLHECPGCDSKLVYPVCWSEADHTHWEVSLRCPDCEWSETATFDQETVERFDEELDRGTDNLVDDLKRLI